MKILYISFDNPAIDAILNGMNESKLAGLPALFYPFKELINRGHTIDLLLYTETERTVIESSGFKQENLIQIHPRITGALRAIELPFVLAKKTNELLRKNHYDFVYGMTEGSHMAVCVAYKKGIPCGLRQYGVQEMTNVLEDIPNVYKRRWKALKDYTYITLSMQSKKSFLLATNDGSRMDELYRILGVKKKKFPFFFWHSGVFIPAEQPIVNCETQVNYPKTYDPMALSMINRIADVKRQDRAVQILGELHRRGYQFHLYFVGELSSQTMLDATNKAISENGVEDFVHFEGSKSQNECRQYARNSFATLLPCEWNRVNVFYESMGEGALVVTNDNHSIDEFIEPNVNCLLFEEDNFAQAAEKIIALIDKPEEMKAIRAAAYQTAKNKFMSLEKRFGLEAQLVEDAAKKSKLSRYPEVL